ncbi:HNH endonuclease [Aureimonas ureilytica]|uniref:HNH endonuclease n=1 Tax=Aureimonas ureilytica TaxID=401562 RepID=UPI000B108D25|nr:HNH endonuclease [Aureimonas ureilytica]
MHIALGVRSSDFPIDDFLDAPGKTDAVISVAADPAQTTTTHLAFSGNPKRRGGEWRIRDQYSHRHPAWTSSTGFPATYDPKNPPFILIFKVGKSFHARFAFEKQLLALNASRRPIGMPAANTGIGIAPTALLATFKVPDPSRFDAFLSQADIISVEDFDPKNISDGRKRIIAAVVRRLGQQAFRRKLVSAYAGQCAMTQCNTLWVLEAAHISPYRGLKTNTIANGLLLRADVHTLFDLALISVDPKKLIVKASRLLRGSQYEALNGRGLRLPAKSSLHPSAAALEYHFSQFHG